MFGYGTREPGVGGDSVLYGHVFFLYKTCIAPPSPSLNGYTNDILGSYLHTDL